MFQELAAEVAEEAQFLKFPLEDVLLRGIRHLGRLEAITRGRVEGDTPLALGSRCES